MTQHRDGRGGVHWLVSDGGEEPINTDPDEMDSLYKVFRKGFLESGEGWNGETYYGNSDAYERRLQARFEALEDAGKFDAMPDNKLRELVKEWRQQEKDAGPGHMYLLGCANDLEELIEE